MESNTQGHGTIKKLRTGAVVSTLALTAFGVSTGVSASETEVAVNEPATRVVAQDEVVPKVPSQSDVDKAKAESDKASQDVAKQKEVVASTEANIANAEKTIAETTKKVEEAKSVTPEKVAEAKADAEKKANELATAEKTVADADKSVSATAEKVEDRTKVVSNAEKTATATANKVADAQKKVDSLSSTTDVAPLEKEVVTLTNQVSADTQAVATAQTNLDNGKKAQSNKDQAIKDAQTGVSSAETKLSQATTALANAKADQVNKDQAIATAKADLDRAKEELAGTGEDVKNTITVSPEYISLLKEYFEKGRPAELGKKLTKLGYKELEKLGEVEYYNGDLVSFTIPFNGSERDKKRVVDIYNLDFETRKELSLYAADLFNQVRKQFGTAPAKVTADSIKMADEIAKASNGTQGHNRDVMRSVGEDNKTAVSELIHNVSVTIPVNTVYDLKQQVLGGIYGMLYWDGHAKWGHAKGVSDVSTNKFLSHLQYIGVSVGKADGITKIHFDGTSDNVIDSDSKFDKTEIVSDKAEIVANLRNKVANSEKAYNNAVKASQEAKSTVATAQTDYTNAETALANARTNLSNVVGNKIDVPALEKALADAESKLAQDTKALQTAKESLALAKSNATDKAKALAEAKSALETAKAEQSNADKALTTAKGELEVLTKAHDVAVLARKSAGQDLFRKREASKEATDTYTVLELALTKRNEVLKTLEAGLTDAKSKLGVLRAELETAKDELARLEGIAEAKARVHANLKDLKDRYETEQAEKRRLEELSRKADAIRKAGGQPKEVTNADGKVVDIVDAKAQNRPVSVATVGTKDDKTYQAPAKATNVKAEPKKQLPNTGTKGSMLGLLGLGLLAGLGLGYTKKNLRK
ncbi:LPXTG cell wall surface protein [Streptococcus mitis]|uniref:LPXTG cell wall surface protein n=1 Tax=Streptococcus mitis TaxID=28037 RepID=A0A4U9ZHT1_STRMT|nr:SEC10/PgrA surface exclusion domain-containing protein [Streptococcus mitis]VTS38691.1 LPXTG cell wall surface protein [Streptococcus mitis]